MEQNKTERNETKTFEMRTKREAITLRVEKKARMEEVLRVE